MVCGFLIAVASLAVELRLKGAQASIAAAPGLWNTGSVVVVHRLSLVAASRGYSLVVVFSLLIAVASLVAEHRL